MNRVLIIANPTAGAGAGRVNKQRLLEIAARDIGRERRGKPTLQVEIAFETTRETVIERARQATIDGLHIVVAAGGDGTVNAVANGLMKSTATPSEDAQSEGVQSEATQNRSSQVQIPTRNDAQSETSKAKNPVTTRANLDSGNFDAANSGAKKSAQDGSEEGSPTPILGVLPMGTGNVFAFNLGIERGLRAACRVIRAGDVRRVDVGTARALSGENRDETRHFLLMAGVGFDAKVVEDTSLRLKYVLRDFAYVVKVMQNGVTHRGTPLRLRFAEGFEYSNQSWLVMIGNAAAYAWDIRFTSRAQLDDGMLDVCLFPYQNKVASIRQVLEVLTGRHIERGQVEYWKTAGLTIESDEPVPVQLDGDEWARTPIAIGVLPRALRVLAPRPEVQPTPTKLP